MTRSTWRSHREERRRVRVLGSARPTNQEHRATPLELFFDLVYIFAATQVTAYMAYERRLPQGASGRDPAVPESMRTVAPQDHATYAPGYGHNLAADYRRQPVGLAPPFQAEDRVVVLKPL